MPDYENRPEQGRPDARSAAGDPRCRGAGCQRFSRRKGIRHASAEDLEPACPQAATQKNATTHPTTSTSGACSYFRDTRSFPTPGTHQRKKVLAQRNATKPARDLEKLHGVDGACVGHYIVMPDTCISLPRLAIRTRATHGITDQTVEEHQFAEDCGCVSDKSPPIWAIRLSSVSAV